MIRSMRDTTNWTKETKPCLACQTQFVSFVWRKQIFCSRSCKGKVAGTKGKKILANSGPNHYLWIADRSKLAVLKNGEQYRNSPAYREWSRSVKNRDGWKCKIANIDCNGRLESHHILPYKDHPELRYEINNGITLCHFHHPRKRDDEIKLSPYFQQLVMSNSK